MLIKSKFLKVLISAGLVVCSCPAFAADVIDTAQLNSLIRDLSQKIVIVDVRSGADYVKEHLPGAINASHQSIISSKQYRDSTIVVYCSGNSCSSSKLVAQELSNNGYKAMSLDGGIETWKAKGYKTEGETIQAQLSAREKIIYPDELYRQLASGNYLIIDTRPARQYKAAHLPGAKNIEAESITLASEKLSKDKIMVICDNNSSRAKQSAATLKKLGFSAMELSGGITNWAGKKLPLESGADKAQ